MRFILGMVLLVFPLATCGGAPDEAATSGSEEASIDALPSEAQPPEAPPANMQMVHVTVEGSAYLFSPETVQVGRPVRLVFDPDGLPGCSRDIAIQAYQITKTITAEDTTIEFIPEVAGPIAVACTMNMYKGTLRAE